MNYDALREAIMLLKADQRPAARAIFFELLANNGEMPSGQVPSVTRLPRQRCRTLLKALEGSGAVSLVSTKSTSELTIKLTTAKATRTRTSKKRQPADQPPHQPSDEAKKAAALWDSKRMLPKSDWSDYYKTFDDMHRLDGLAWSEIKEIVQWATTEWEQKHIQSPTKLRLKSQSYPDLKTHQVISGQIQSGSAKSKNGFVSKRPTLQKQSSMSNGK